MPPTPTPTPVPPTPTPDDTVVLPCHDILVPVDRERRLPADCVPPDLVEVEPMYAMGEELVLAEIYDALHMMLSDAWQAGHQIVVRSAYRSYQAQEQIFWSLVDSIGLEEAERRSARPGHSEHQLGTTVDVTGPSVDHELSQVFADTPAGQWLQANAWSYGFVMSYPEGTEHITGYIFEPWHWRYVGVEHAQAIVEGGQIPGQYLLEIYGP